jgi:hypothetical protein
MPARFVFMDLADGSDERSPFLDYNGWASSMPQAAAANRISQEPVPPSFPTAGHALIPSSKPAEDCEGRNTASTSLRVSGDKYKGYPCEDHES